MAYSQRHVVFYNISSAKACAAIYHSSLRRIALRALSHSASQIALWQKEKREEHFLSCTRFNARISVIGDRAAHLSLACICAYAFMRTLR